MRFKSFAYKALRASNDINAVSKGRTSRRVARRAVGRTTSRWFRG